MSILRARKALLLGLSGAVAAGLAATALSAAQAAPQTAATAEVATGMSVAVEDFSYPEADRIFQERGLKLFKGDGHILVAPCDESPNQIRIWTRVGDEADRFCFQATASTGYLTLEVPEVYALQTADHPISADLTAEGKTESVDVGTDAMVGVGEGLGNPPAMLVELRVTG